MTGIEVFLEVLAGSGVKYIFGNPGTTELPLNDALARDGRFRYVFGLHEVPVAATADGYAMASGQLGVVNVHICCGLGNAMGMLYNARCEGTPLLLTAGQQDRRLLLEEPVLAGDMVAVTRPWTKWAHEVTRVEDVAAATRRAVETALTPPTGPVFLSLPLDVQTEEVREAELRGGRTHRLRPAPDPLELRRAAELLAAAADPVILAGSRVTEAGAVNELAALAEALGAPVYSECATSHGRLPLAADHPLYAGPLPLWSPEVEQRLTGHDVLLVVGMNLLRQYIHHEPARPVPRQLPLIHLDSDARELGKNYRTEVALACDIQSGLGQLAGAVRALQSEADRRKAAGRLERCRERRRADQDALRRKAAGEHNARPMTPLTLMTTLAAVLPDRTAVVEEAVTTTDHLFERLGVLRDPSGYFGHRGWALGWGLGCALGVKLAWPERPVLCLLGEGSALYGIQGLWTAAHEKIPVAFVVCNNAQYKILKVCAGHLPLPQMQAGRYLGTDLTSPEVDFVALARSFGVESVRVHGPDELADCVRESLRGDRPKLIDVPISRE